MAATAPSTAKKIWGLLTQDQRRSAMKLFGLMIAAMLLETLSVGLVIPALALLTQDNLAARFPRVTALLTFGSENPHTLIVNGMLTLVAIYLIKNLFLAYFAWRQNDFTFRMFASVSERLFKQYLRQPYAFHLQRNSAILIRNITGEVDIFTVSIVRSSMLLLAESLTFVGLILLVISVEPVGAIIVAAITALVSFIFYRISRPYVLRWGKSRQHHAGLRFQHLQQGLGGVKDVKLLGRELDFLDRFMLHTESYARVGGLQNTLLELPRLWLELLAMGGLATLVIVMLAQGRTMASIFPVLGLFAAAAFRLMPALNRALGSIQSIKFGLPVIDTLYSELLGLPETPSGPSGAPMPFDTALVLRDVSFRYPAGEVPVLPRINVVIPCGSMIGFIGESGAGKSTLVDILLGLLTPESGTVSVDGVDIQTNLRGWQDQIGYVPSTIFLTDDSLRRNVAFGLPDGQIDEGAVSRAIRAAQLEAFVNALPSGLDTVVGERGIRLSGGQRQRIGIARALYHDPRVLVLDEATSSLDTITEQGVMAAVRALHGKKTVIIVSHRLSTVEDCDRLYRLDRGWVVEEGTSRIVLSQGGGRGK